MCWYCIYFTTLNLSHFKVAEAMGLKVVASTFPAVAPPPYKISSKSINRFKSYGGGGTQTGDLTSLLSFMESRLGIANLVEINLSRTIYTVF
jgi:hypothetical protein